MIAYPYSLFKRHSKRLGKSVYYVRFRDPDTGKRLPGRSSGETDKNRARIWADKQLRSGKYSAKAEMKFTKYAEGWWVWGKCPYIKRKQYLGQNFTKRTADEYKSALKNYYLPFFKDYKLRKIDRALIEKFRSHLIGYTRENGQQLSASTINNIVSIVSVMLQEATRVEYIHRNPARGIGKLSTRDTKKRDILTRKEADRLFEKSKISTIWPERKHYVLNLLASTTGMRLGECLGIQASHIKKEPESGKYIITLKQAWDDKFGLNPPKWNSVRTVPITDYMRTELQKLIDKHPLKESSDVFIFYGIDPRKPMNRTTVMENYYAALEKIGIDEDLRKKRNILFHSWRHFFITTWRPYVDDSIIRAITGHRTIEMTENYTHFKLEHFDEFRKIQEEQFSA